MAMAKYINKVNSKFSLDELESTRVREEEWKEKPKEYNHTSDTQKVGKRRPRSAPASLRRLGESAEDCDFSLRTSIGRRKPGGGKRLPLFPVDNASDQWFLDERCNGSHVDKPALYTEFLLQTRKFLADMQSKEADLSEKGDELP